MNVSKAKIGLIFEGNSMKNIYFYIFIVIFVFLTSYVVSTSSSGQDKPPSGTAVANAPTTDGKPAHGVTADGKADADIRPGNEINPFSGKNAPFQEATAKTHGDATAHASKTPTHAKASSTSQKENGKAGKASARAKHYLPKNRTEVETKTNGQGSAAEAFEGTEYGTSENGGSSEGYHGGTNSGMSDGSAKADKTGSEASVGHVAVICTCDDCIGGFAGVPPGSDGSASVSWGQREQPGPNPPLEEVNTSSTKQSSIPTAWGSFKISLEQYMLPNGIVIPFYVQIIANIDGKQFQPKPVIPGHGINEMAQNIVDYLNTLPGIMASVTGTGTIVVNYANPIALVLDGGSPCAGPGATGVIVKSDP